MDVWRTTKNVVGGAVEGTVIDGFKGGMTGLIAGGVVGGLLLALPFLAFSTGFAIAFGAVGALVGGFTGGTVLGGGTAFFSGIWKSIRGLREGMQDDTIADGKRIAQLEQAIPIKQAQLQQAAMGFNNDFARNDNAQRYAENKTAAPQPGVGGPG